MHRGTHQAILLSVKLGEGGFGARPSKATLSGPDLCKAR